MARKIMSIYNKNNYQVKNGKYELDATKQNMKALDVMKNSEADYSDTTASDILSSRIMEKVADDYSILSHLNSSIIDLSSTNGDSKKVTFLGDITEFDTVSEEGVYDGDQIHTATTGGLKYITKELKISDFAKIYPVTDDALEDSVFDLTNNIEEATKEAYEKTILKKFLYAKNSGILSNEFVGEDGDAVVNIAKTVSDLTYDKIVANLNKLGENYGTDTSNLTMYVGSEVFDKIMTFEEVKTQDKFGADATNKKGTTKTIAGVRIFKVDGLKKVKGNATVSETESENTFQLIAIAHNKSSKIGIKRNLRVEESRDAKNQKTDLVASTRFGTVTVWNKDRKNAKSVVYLTIGK